MDLHVKSQIDDVINSYMGKQLMMIIPSQSLETNVDASQINRFTLVNKQIRKKLHIKSFHLKSRTFLAQLQRE